MFKKKKTKEEIIVNAEVPEEISASTQEESVAVQETVTIQKEAVPLENIAISLVHDKKSLTYSVVCVKFNLGTGDVGTPEVLHANKDVGEAEYLFKVESVKLGIFR